METERFRPGLDDETEAVRPRRHKLTLLGRSFPIPQSRAMRVAVGVLLLIGGVLGFLPVLGFWMFPLGLLVLSYDFPSVRRRRRQLEVWWANKRGRRRRRP